MKFLKYTTLLTLLLLFSLRLSKCQEQETQEYNNEEQVEEAQEITEEAQEEAQEEEIIEEEEIQDCEVIEELEEFMCPEYFEETTINGVPMTFYPCCVDPREQCDNHLSPVCVENMVCEAPLKCHMEYKTELNVCNACKGRSHLQYAKGECPWQVTGGNEKECPKFIEEAEVNDYWMTFHPCCVNSNDECGGPDEIACIEELRCEGGHCRRHYETVKSVCNACRGHRDWMYSKGQCPWEAENGGNGRRVLEGQHWNRKRIENNEDGTFLN